MKLGVLDLVPVFAGADAGFALEQALKLARTAEEWGYHRYWVAEHHDMPGLACSSPEVLLAYIGAHTESIRLGSGAVLLPHYKPIKVAESFHLLATLNPGRIDLGIGRAPGGSAQVSMALSDNFLENVRKMPDSLRDLMSFLTHSFHVENTPVTARPIPPVPPEVWMLGTNRKSAAYAAEFGTGYVFGQFMSDMDAAEVISAYRQQFRPSPLCPEPRAIVAVGVICGETHDEARRLAAEAKAWFKPEGYPADETPSSERRLLIGTPEEVRTQLEDMQGLYNADEFLVVTAVPDYEQRLRSYELLAGSAR